MDHTLEHLSHRLGQYLRQQGLTLVTAESCTGGWIAKVITDIPGSSGWFERGFVTYSNAAKEDLLGVASEVLVQHGAVSEETVTQMALGALTHSPADVAIAVTGIAGPDGGTPNKPVGTVWFTWAVPGQEVLTRRERFTGEREAVRRQTVRLALEVLIELLDARP